MALVSIQRSPTPSPTHELPLMNATNKIFRSHFDNKSGDAGGIAESDSSSEYYFAVRGAAVILPKNEFQLKRETCNGGEIKQHLQSMLQLLRPRDTLRMAVRLQNMFSNYTRYLVIISTSTRHDNRESSLLGIDYITPNQPAIALILPIWANTAVKLDGDGGISFESSDSYHLFKPISVQAMWSVFQALHKELLVARNCPMFHCRISQSWLKYYEKKISSPESIRSEWYYTFQDTSDLKATTIDCYKEKPPQRAAAEELIRNNLKNIMHSVDLDEVTSKDIRLKLEEKLRLDLSDYRDFIDHEMLVILGQMDTPSMVFPYLYLGTEWNASNWEELKRNNVGFILNVAKEVDNFFPGLFEYMNVRVSDEESSELLKYWEATSKFIVKAKMRKSAVLVHCKKGISRSSSTVIAYAMKEYGLPLEDALNYVKNKRNCITPNKGFMEQLKIYQGILLASRNRNSFLWNRLSLPIADYATSDSRYGSPQIGNSKLKSPLNRSASLMLKTKPVLTQENNFIDKANQFKKCPSTADLYFGTATQATSHASNLTIPSNVDLRTERSNPSVDQQRVVDDMSSAQQNDGGCYDDVVMRTFCQPRPKVKKFASLQERLRHHSLNLNCVRDILTKFRGVTSGTSKSDSLSLSSGSDSDSGSFMAGAAADALAAEAVIDERRQSRSSSSDSAVVADLPISVTSAEFCDISMQEQDKTLSGSVFRETSLCCSRTSRGHLQSVSLNSSPNLADSGLSRDRSEMLDLGNTVGFRNCLRTSDRCCCDRSSSCREMRAGENEGETADPSKSCLFCIRTLSKVQSQNMPVIDMTCRKESVATNHYAASARTRCKSEPVSFGTRRCGRDTVFRFSCRNVSSSNNTQGTEHSEVGCSDSADSLTNKSSFYPSVRRLASSLELGASPSSGRAKLVEESITKSPSNSNDSMVRSLVGYFESNHRTHSVTTGKLDQTSYDSASQQHPPSFYLNDCKTTLCNDGLFNLTPVPIPKSSSRRSFHCLQEFNNDISGAARLLKRNASCGYELKSTSSAIAFNLKKPS